MGGGYRPPAGDSVQPITDAITETRRQLREVQRPSAVQLQELLQQVQATLANIQSQVDQVAADWMTANGYTRTQVDSKIASPGDISPGNVTASGQVVSAAALKSPGSHDYIVATNYVAGWINGDGTLGTSPSTKDVKKDLQAMTPQDVFNRLNTLTAYWGRYEWDDETTPLKVFLLAEDVKAAGFGPDVAPVVPGDQPVNVGTDEYPAWVQPGDAYTVNYSQLIVPMISAGQAMQAEISALQARLDKAGL